VDHRAVCFVIMPFGRKTDAAGRMVDFDRIYAEVIAPAVEAAGLDGIRADEEQGAGFIHKLMYERLLLSEYAIADLTLLNANVYYELGIRHAARPETTVLTLALGCPLPFDVGPLRALPYALNEDGADAAPDRIAPAPRDGFAAVPTARGLPGGADRPAENRRLSHQDRDGGGAERAARQGAR